MNNIEVLINQIAKEAKPKWVYNSNEFIPNETPVYYSGPFFDEDEIRMALTAFLTGKWLVSGEYVHKFQIEFAKLFNVAHVHMVNSGSSANLILIAALKKKFGWRDGDEIIVSPVGFPTTISPIVQNGLQPIFADIEMETLNFNLDLVEASITPYTRAIFVSPVLGNPPNMDILRDMCEEYQLLLIGDNCDSLGSKWKGEFITDCYYAWTTSFYPAHHITTGEGGMICSNDEHFIDSCRSLSWWGRDCYCVGSANLLPCGTCKKRFDNWLPNYDGIVDHKYVFTSMGYNLKPLDLQGAIGLAQLKKFDTIDRNRKHHKKIISNFVEKITGVTVPEQNYYAHTSWFGVPIICDTPQLKNRLQKHFEDNKIQTRNYFAGNILLHPGYSHLGNFADYPNANHALSRVFFIGCSPHYSEEILTYIGKVCEEFIP